VGESSFHTNACRPPFDDYYGKKPAESEAQRAPDSHETLELPPPGPKFQEGESPFSASGAAPPAPPDPAFAPPESGGPANTETTNRQNIDADGAVLQSQTKPPVASADAWSACLAQDVAPPAPSCGHAEVHSAPACTASQELAIALGRLNLKTDG
jgi:hypothetical protein